MIQQLGVATDITERVMSEQRNHIRHGILEMLASTASLADILEAHC